MNDLIDIEELYENAPCGYFSFLPDGKVIRANKTFKSWIGFSEEELRDLNFLDLLYKGNTIYYEMIFLPMLRMQGYINEISFEILKKDGSTFPGLINAVAVRDDAHNIKSINVTLFNITDRKKYEKELLAAKKNADNERLKFEILSNQIPGIIWTATDTGKIDFLNQHYYKETKKKPIDKKEVYVHDLVHEKDLDFFKNMWTDAWKNNAPFDMEVRLKSEAENPDWYLLKGVPFVVDEYALDKERRWLGTFTNINHQIKSLQVKDDFISIASHELKTPITIVKSYLQILMNDVENENHLAIIEKCESATNSMQELIDDLLDTSQINAENLRIHKKKESLIAIIKNCIANQKLTKKSHEIQLQGDLEPVAVFVDKNRLERVVNNLLSNAIKYSPNADKVIVSINKNETSGKVQVAVKDYGIGIPEEDLDKVFNRYFRVSSKTSSAIKGWGLGLFIIQQIAKAHNSIINVESELGKGSTFFFELDIVDEKK